MSKVVLARYKPNSSPFELEAFLVNYFNLSLVYYFGKIQTQNDKPLNTPLLLPLLFFSLNFLCCIVQATPPVQTIFLSGLHDDTTVGDGRLEFLINMMIMSTTIVHIVYLKKQVERYQFKLERDKETERHKIQTLYYQERTNNNNSYKLVTKLVINQTRVVALHANYRNSLS